MAWAKMSAAASAVRMTLGVDPEGDGGVGVTQSRRDDIDRHAGQQQGRGVDVP